MSQSEPPSPACVPPLTANLRKQQTRGSRDQRVQCHLQYARSPARHESKAVQATRRRSHFLQRKVLPASDVSLAGTGDGGWLSFVPQAFSGRLHPLPQPTLADLTRRVRGRQCATRSRRRMCARERGLHGTSSSFPSSVQITAYALICEGHRRTISTDRCHELGYRNRGSWPKQ